MNTPRTDKHKFRIGESDHFAVHEVYARQLETELAAMTESRDKWQELAAKYAQEREHNANMALASQAELKSEREKCAKLQGIIKRASKKFCEDGPDGEIAAGMFRILGEYLSPETLTQAPE